MSGTLNTKVLISGAGTGGYVACIRCGQRGLDTGLVDGGDAAVLVQRIKRLPEHPATLWMG